MSSLCNLKIIIATYYFSDCISNQEEIEEDSEYFVLQQEVKFTKVNATVNAQIEPGSILAFATLNPA